MFIAARRHESIPTAQNVIREMGYAATFSEDPASFANSSNLAGYQAIVFLSNSDEILDTPEQKANLESYLVNGGGLVGIHSATAALFSTPWYGTAFGAFFDYHPTLQNATFMVVNDSHPSTSSLPSSFNYIEEVYNFRSDSRATNVSVSQQIHSSRQLSQTTVSPGPVRGWPPQIVYTVL